MHIGYLAFLFSKIQNINVMIHTPVKGLILLIYLIKLIHEQRQDPAVTISSIGLSTIRYDRSLPR